MTAVLYRLRAGVRRRWRATAVMTLLVGVIISVPLVGAAGARRTVTAPDRYAHSQAVRFDAAISQVQTRVPRTAEIAALPGVAAVEANTFVFGGLLPRNGAEPLDALVFIGPSTSSGLRLVEGRQPDPSARGEFVATRSFVVTHDASLGDEYQLITLTQEQGRTNGFSNPDPQGPTLTARLVGVVDGPSELDDPSPIAFFGESLLGAGDIGLSQTNMAARLEPGVSVSDLRAEVDSLANHDDFSVSDAQIISPTIRRAVDAQGQGLWLLSAAAAVAAIAVLGQLLGRHARLSTDEHQALTAVGYSSSDRFIEGIGMTLVPAALGTALAACIAVLPSGLFPTGFARHVEPSPGLRVDGAVLLLGAVAAATALLIWVAVSLTLSRRVRVAGGSSSIVDAIARKAVTPTMATGLRLAFARRRTDRGAIAGAQVTVLLIVTAGAGALVFGASLDRLVTEPARYGSSYDYVIGNQGADVLPADVIERLQNEAAIRSLTTYAVDHARIGDATIEVLGMQPVLGDGLPTVVAGRLPLSDDEVAFGRVEAHRVGARVGQPITLSGPAGSKEYHVTGLIVVPGLGPNDGLGQGAVLTLSGLRQISKDATATAAVVRVRDHSAETQARLTDLVGAPPDGPFEPGAITNVARVRSIPFIVAAFLSALGLVTVSHLTITSARARRRDLAVLRALGADQQWVGRTMHWHATCSVAGAALLGLPLGFVAGRAVFAAFADSMGAIDAAAAPVLLFVALVGALLLVVNLCAVRMWSRLGATRPAALLRAE